jgi:3-methyladenine DNA glycosylase AlkD
MTALAKKIRAELISLGDEKIARHSLGFFKTGKGEYGEGDIFIGVRVPVIRALAKKYGEISLSEIVSILQSKVHEERMLALVLMVNKFKKAQVEESQALYSSYLDNTQYINNWDLIDISALHIVGAFLYDRDRSILMKLAQSKSMWERRIAIMSTFYFIRKNDFRDTLKIAQLLINDQQDLIHKAVGWMLREIGNRNLKTEEDFLKPFYNKMPRTMLRYSIEKFPEAKRKKYLSGSA